jgi:hypothetical protein
LPELRGIIDTFADSDPDKIVELGIAISQVAVAIVALNTALKVFAGLQAAFKVLTSAAGVLLIPLAAGGSAEVMSLEDEAAARQVQARGGGPLGGRSIPGQRPTGNVSRPQVVNVSGIVGSPYQVFRELERINSTGQRSASTFSGGNR